jgi:serine/threonine-protein kinase
MIGKSLLHYEIQAKIGAGGMGEVYQAHDTKLRRDVALKLLPPEVVHSPEKLARFEREARVLAALNHPHVGAIYGLETDADKTFLVLELVPGEDLGAVLSRGPLPQDQVLQLGRQIAEGLEAAHEQGIIHRDLKPQNIMLTPEGTVKILDFGLAKAFEADGMDSSLTSMATVTSNHTLPGVVMGTAAYMSPEQARGTRMDRRTDIWAFGCVLFEMLTGQRVFEGETVSDTLAAVLRADLPYEELSAETPPAVRRLLERCLERDPRKRLRDVGEARIRLERWQNDPSSLMQSDLSIMAMSESAGPRRWLPWGVALLAMLALAGVWFTRGNEGSSPGPSLELAIDLQYRELLQEDVATNVILSPDGQTMAYLAKDRIHLRRLDSRQTRTLESTSNARIACFSPDGQWLAFSERGKLKRISVTGGSSVEICDAPDSRGIAWVNESTLVFNPTFAAALSVVSLSDGVARPLTQLDESAGERSHRWPHALPDGKSVLFLCQYYGRDYDEGDIMMVDLESGERRVVYRGGASPRYVASGHLLFVRDESVFAIPMDPETGLTSGLATPVLDRVWTSIGDQEVCDGSAQFDVSANGLLVYRSSLNRSRKSQAYWLDMASGEFEAIGSVSAQSYPVLSPDGRRLALMRGETDDPDVYIVDLETGIDSRLTFEDGGDQLGCWSPDSKMVYYTRPTVDGTWVVYRKAADGTGAEVEIVRLDNTIIADDVTPDGRWLLLTVWSGANLWDLNKLDLESPEEGLQGLLTGPEQQYACVASPDGQWLLHHQNAGEVWNLYVRRLADAGGRWEIAEATSQFQHAVWSEDGRTIYARDGRGFLKIDLSFENGSVQARPAQLLQLDEGIRSSNWKTSDTMRDGSRSIVFMPEDDAVEGASAEDPPIVLVTNWFEELKKKAPLDQ